MPCDALPVVLLCGLVIAVLALAVAYAMAAQQARWDREDDNTADASLARVDASVAAKVRYPQGFLWGVATAPIQNEGHNPWTTWSQWAATDRVADAPLQTCNAWKTFESVDVPAAAWLGCNAFRLGVDWGRVEPQEGKFNHTALRRYRGMLLALREAGMEPVLTLCHFALPNWAPGWEAGEAMAARFGRFVRVVLQHMGDLVRWFITLNEPQIDAVNTHLRGERWPGKTCVWATVRAMRGMWLAHNEAARAIRAAVPDAHISIAKNYVLARPASTRNPADLAMAALVDAIYNNHFIKACVSGHFSLLGYTAKGDAGSLTFLGLNHYNHVSVHGLSADVRMESGAPEGLSFRAPAMGWEMRPASLFTAVSEAWERFGLPILVTEAGTADGHDTHRPDFVARQLYGLANASAAGVPVLGYMHWTLLDSWEWCEGYAARFGMFASNFEALRAARAQGQSGAWMRANCFTPRRTAHEFRRIAHTARGVTLDTALEPAWEASTEEAVSQDAVGHEQDTDSEIAGRKGDARLLAGRGIGRRYAAHKRAASRLHHEPARATRPEGHESATAVA